MQESQWRVAVLEILVSDFFFAQTFPCNDNDRPVGRKAQIQALDGTC